MRFLVMLVLPSVSSVAAQSIVSGRVTESESGRPLPAVRIEAFAVDGVSRNVLARTWSDSLGSYVLQEVPGKKISLRATYRDGSHEYTLATAPWDPVEENRRIDFEFVRPRLTLAAGGMHIIAHQSREGDLMKLGGTVVDGVSGTRLPGAWIKLEGGLPASGDGLPIEEDSVTSDEQGRFVFEERAPGIYRVTFGADGYVTVRSEPERFEGTVGVVLRIPEALSDDTMSVQSAGRILDESGRTLNDVTRNRRGMDSGVLVGRIRVGGRSGAGAIVQLIPSRLDAQVDPDGYFEFEEVPPGTYSLRITMEGRVTSISNVRVRRGGNEVYLDL